MYTAVRRQGLSINTGKSFGRCHCERSVAIPSVKILWFLIEIATLRSQ